MSDWLDLQLAEELRPVKAPDDLWRRVQTGRRTPKRAVRWWAIRVPVLAALALIVLVVALTSRPRRSALESLAAHELSNPATLDLHSSDAAEIGAWLRREAGLDLQIPRTSPATLRGARVIRRRDASIGEVAYTVGGKSALLLVAAAGGPFDAPVRHGGAVWRSGRQVYAIASPTPMAGCALCHANL
jgi:hypothetical protein